MKVLIVFVTVLFVAVPLSAQSVDVDRPNLAMDDTWSYREGGSTFSFVVRGATSDGYVIEQLNKEGHHVATMHWTHDLIFDKAFYFHPQWPLDTGKQWQFTHSGAAGNDIGGVNNYVTTETVVGVESVSVPAGTFETIRIHGKDCNTTQRNSCGDFDVWYAPKVKYAVKIAKTGGYWTSHEPRELLSYNVTP